VVSVGSEVEGTMKATALELFGGLAKSYERAVDFATLFQDRYWKTWVAQRTSAQEGGMVLDLGCGTLLLEQRLQRKGYNFVGLDLTEKMIRIGRAKGLKGIRLLVNGDAENLPFSDEAFASIVSCYVVKYVNLEKLAEEMARVTKPRGTVVLYDFVRPRGPFAPFLEAYIRGGMRAVGALLGLAKKDSAFTFNNLPQIVDHANWDSTIGPIMESKGFVTIAMRHFTGGIVYGYCGAKRA
jgi:demethylmenaquinone methyltransferase/2-methoxy-6-polyprenyl-1,4-benzoquinol methylase